MLSMAIKNTLLMVLIILIFHFLIKKYMLERMQDMVHHAKRNDVFLPASCNDEKDEKEKMTIPPPVNSIAKVEAHEHTAVDFNKQKKDREEELLRFVYEAGPVTEPVSSSNTTRSDKEMIAVVKAPPSEKPSFAVKEYDVMVTSGIGSFEGLKGNDVTESLDSFYSASLVN